LTNEFIKWAKRNREKINNITEDIIVDSIEKAIDKSPYRNAIIQAFEQDRENRDKDFICVDCKKVFKWNQIMDLKSWDWSLEANKQHICPNCFEKRIEKWKKEKELRGKE